MKNIFSLIYIAVVCLFTSFTYAQSLAPCSDCSPSAATIEIYTPNSTTATFAPPSQYQTAGSIGKLVLTYPISISIPSGITFKHDPTQWGVAIGATTGNYLKYYQAATFSNGVTVTSDVGGFNTSTYKGSIKVTIDFTKANNILPNDIIGAISNGGIQFTPFYNGISTPGGTSFYWQADTGAMVNAPSISVKAQDSAFVVTLSAPTSLNAVEQATQGTLTATANPNTLSGYVIVYWLDKDASGNSTGCGASPGNWQFAMNPVSLKTASSTPYTCTYTPYQSSFMSGGSSSAIGCSSIAPSSLFATNSISLTGDLAAIPYTPGITNPSQISSDSNGTPSGCYNVVYVPGSQSSWSKGNISNGAIYGVMAWALNNAYDSSSKTLSPNYSLAHSNISYVTGISLPLASTDKSPNLPKTKDCFVVTAASGDINSDSVFYWRILRDTYLTPMGITPFYYKHAQVWANWLDENPKLKPAFNLFFEYSGKALYRLSGYAKKSGEFFESLLQKAGSIWNQEASAQEIPESPLQNEIKENPNIKTEEPAKQENLSNTNNKAKTEEPTKVDEPTKKEDLGNSNDKSKLDDAVKKEETDKQENLSDKAQAEEPAKLEESAKKENLGNTSDKTKEEEPAKKDVINKNIMPPSIDKPKKDKETYKSNAVSNKDKQPNYDLFLSGGILIPTDDKVYYDKYYNSQPTGHFEIGSNYLFWFGNFGLSTGILGRYLFNTSTSSTIMLGTQQTYTRKFYALTAEALLGIRYRNPTWSYIQPGIFVGVGGTRFREDASTDASNNSTNKPLGITQFSPIFEFGGNLDISLVPIFDVYPGELGILLTDILFRVSASYNVNPSQALSSTGLLLQGGFVFLLE